METETDIKVRQLNDAQPYVGKSDTEGEISQSAVNILSTAKSLYDHYFLLNKSQKDTPELAYDPRIVDIRTFQRFISPIDLQIIANYFLKVESRKQDEERRAREAEAEKRKQEEEKKRQEEQPKEKEEEAKKAPAPTKETSTVPADLESLVAQYKANQADKQLSSNDPHSVTAAVKRARETWETKHRLELIQKNRTEAQQKADKAHSDKFFEEKIDPKTGNRDMSESNIQYVAYRTIEAQAAIQQLKLTRPEIEKAADDLSYLIQAGATEVTDLYTLNIYSQLALRNIDGQVFFSPVSKVDISNPHSDDHQYNEKTTQEYFTKSTKDLFDELHKLDLDIEEKISIAKNDTDRIQKNLFETIPNATLPSPLNDFLKAHGEQFEKDIRTASPSTIGINPTPAGAKAIGVLQTTGGSDRNISPEAVKLMSLGLTSKQLDEAKNNPDSPLGKLYHSPQYKDVFQLVHYQIGKIENTKLGQEITAGIKPLTGLQKNLTEYYNTHPTLQKTTQFVLNPVGTARAWASRKAGEQIGKHLIEHTGSAIAQKVGGYLVKEGLEQGVKTLAKEAVTKAIVKGATWAATKLGISVALESMSIGSFGLTTLIDIGVQLALWVGEKTIGAAYATFQDFMRNVYGEEFKARDLLVPLAAGAGIVATATVGAATGLTVLARATKIAIISGITILFFSAGIALFYILSAYAVAPMLSTLVQLDSKEKVVYPELAASSSSDCGWPTRGHFMIQEGPDAGTHSLSHLQAIDIFGPGSILGTDLISSTEGVVSSVGDYSNYGTTIIISTTNKAGSFQVIYGHCLSTNVSPGQHVQQGQKIGAVGFTALFPNPHIHFEYKGIKYNQCPAGGVIIPDGCRNFFECGSKWSN